jgi:hypothetical protein
VTAAAAVVATTGVEVFTSATSFDRILACTSRCLD